MLREFDGMNVVFGFPDRAHADDALARLRDHLPEVEEPLIVEKTTKPSDTVMRTKKVPLSMVLGIAAGFGVGLVTVLFLEAVGNGPLKIGIALAAGGMGAIIGFFVGAMARLDAQQKKTEDATRDLPPSTIVTVRLDDESDVRQARRICTELDGVELLRDAA